MKKTMIAALMLGTLMIPGGSAAPQSPTPADTEMIVVSKAVDLLNALNQLGGHEEIVGQGASQRVVTVPYNFNADTLWAIADDITALRKVVVTYQDTVRALTAAAEAKNGGEVKPEMPAAKTLTADIQKLFDSERPVAKLFRLKRADLKLGENKVHPGIISSLAPILDP